MAMQLGEATISTGASGAEVKAIQEILMGQGYAVGPIDGVFGPQTQTAVQAFQKTKGLIPDGIIGPLTWEALRGKAPVPTVLPTGAPTVAAPAPKMGTLMTVGLYAIGGLAALVMLGSGSKRRRTRR